MELKILNDYMEKIIENKIAIKGDFEIAEVCDDKISMAYNKGVLYGLSTAVEILNDLLDEELETMAANMEGEKR